MCSAALGQSPWRKGYIITTDGTRVEGLLLDEEWFRNPASIEFKTASDAQPSSYLPKDIVEFGSDRPAKYVSAEVSYDIDKQSLDNLPPSREPTLRTEKLFLEVLVDGPVKLYMFTADSEREHFFVNSGSGIAELLNRKYLGPGRTLLLNEKYKQQIILMTNDCPAVQSVAKNLRYDEDRLRKAFISINKCKGYAEEVGETASQPMRKPSYGISLQAYKSSQSFVNIQSDMSKINPGVGVFIELYNKKRPNRLSIRMVGSRKTS
jgi:hypothetical protein